MRLLSKGRNSSAAFVRCLCNESWALVLGITPEIPFLPTVQAFICTVMLSYPLLAVAVPFGKCRSLSGAQLFPLGWGQTLSSVYLVFPDRRTEWVCCGEVLGLRVGYQRMGADQICSCCSDTLCLRADYQLASSNSAVPCFFLLQAGTWSGSCSCPSSNSCENW